MLTITNKLYKCNLKDDIIHLVSVFRNMIRRTKLKLPLIKENINFIDYSCAFDTVKLSYLAYRF